MHNNTLFTQLKVEIDKGELQNDAVSKASVYWHLDHVLKVYNGVCVLLLNSEPSAYKTNFSFFGWWFMTFKYLPRGKGRAPKGTYSLEGVTPQLLEQQLTQVQENLERLEKANPNLFFAHPYFGHFKKAKAITFLNIHPTHHLKIVQQIRKNSI